MGDKNNWLGFDLLGIWAAILRHPFAVFGLPLLFCAFAVGLTWILGADQVATSRFKPEGANGDASRLAGLAAQFGVNVGGTGTGETVAFYAEVAKSREILEQLAGTTFTFATEPEAQDTLVGTPITLLGIEGDSPRETAIQAVDELRDRVSVTTDLESGLVTLRTTAPWAGLAEQLNARALELLNAFNVERRQTRASAERAFAERRAAEVGEDLKDAEKKLESFLDSNRSLEAPRIQFEYRRLQRQVELQQQVYSSLTQAVEQAKLDQVRETPVITVIEGPKGSARPMGAGVVANGLIGLLLGSLLGLALALGSEFLVRLRNTHPEKLEELAAINRGFARRLKIW